MGDTQQCDNRPRRPVSKNMRNLSTQVLHIQNQFKQKKSVEELAEFHNLSEQKMGRYRHTHSPISI